MGTLMNQNPRTLHNVTINDVAYKLKELQAIAAQNKVDLPIVIEIWKIAVMDRQHSLAVQDGDIKDEQLAGLGDLLKQLIETINR